MDKNTIIDECLKVIPERFELVILAAQRAKLLYLGASSPIHDAQHNSSKVEVALDEIAQGLCTRASIIESFSVSIDTQDPNEGNTKSSHTKDIKDGISYDDFDINED